MYVCKGYYLLEGVALWSVIPIIKMNRVPSMTWWRFGEATHTGTNLSGDLEARPQRSSRYDGQRIVPRAVCSLSG